jgi:hypothetical protein
MLAFRARYYPKTTIRCEKLLVKKKVEESEVGYEGEVKTRSLDTEGCGAGWRKEVDISSFRAGSVNHGDQLSGKERL